MAADLKPLEPRPAVEPAPKLQRHRCWHTSGPERHTDEPPADCLENLQATRDSNHFHMPLICQAIGCPALLCAQLTSALHPCRSAGVDHDDNNGAHFIIDHDFWQADKSWTTCYKFWSQESMHRQRHGACMPVRDDSVYTHAYARIRRGGAPGRAGGGGGREGGMHPQTDSSGQVTARTSSEPTERC